MLIRRMLIALAGPAVYLLAAAALAAVLAYPVFSWGGSGSVSDLRTLVSRGGQVMLLLGLVPLWRWLRLGWKDLGWSQPFFRQWLAGFLLGVFLLGLHVKLLIGLGVHDFVRERVQFPELLSILGKALAIGFAIALMEETLFRGALLGILRTRSGAALAIFASSLYFAALHFIGSKWSTEPSHIGWGSGFLIALDGFAHLRQAQPDAFLALFVAGLLLASVRVIWPGSLPVCMGIHAGWVFIIKSAKPLCAMNPVSPHSGWVSRYDFVIGYLSAAWLGLLVIMLWVVFGLMKRHGRRVYRV